MSELASGIVLLVFGAAAVGYSRWLPAQLAALRDRAASRGEALRSDAFERWGPRLLGGAGVVLAALGLAWIVDAVV